MIVGRGLWEAAIWRCSGHHVWWVPCRWHITADSRVSISKSIGFFLCPWKVWSFWLTLFRVEQKWDRTPTNWWAIESGRNWLKVPFQCSAVHIQHLFLISDIRPQKNTEGIRLLSGWLKVASFNLLKFLSLLVYFLWYELLLSSQLGKYPPINRYALFFSLGAAETMARSDLVREDPSSSGARGELRQPTTSLLSLSTSWLRPRAFLFQMDMSFSMRKVIIVWEDGCDQSNVFSLVRALQTKNTRWGGYM